MGGLSGWINFVTAGDGGCVCATQYGGPQSAPKHLSAPAQRIHTMSALCKFMHGAAKVCWAPFPPRAQHQHSRCQLWLRLCFGGHAGVYGEGLGVTDQQDIFSPDKARAFNPFLCARTDNLKARAPFPPRTQHQHSRCQLRLRLCLGGHAGAYGEGVAGVMVEWASGASERTFNQSAANGKKEPGAVRLPCLFVSEVPASSFNLEAGLIRIDRQI